MTPEAMQPDVETKTTARVVAGGTSLEVIGGAGAAVLAIIGLSAYLPFAMCAIGVIAIGGALLFQGGAIAARWRDAQARFENTTAAQGELASGVGTEVFAGAAGIVLGILALAHVMPAILLPVAAIVFGGGLLLGGSAQPEFEKLAPMSQSRYARVAHDAVTATAGIMVLVGIGSAVLGILGLIHVAPYLPLTLVAVLGVGGALLLSGSSLAARFVRRLA